MVLSYEYGKGAVHYTDPQCEGDGTTPHGTPGDEMFSTVEGCCPQLDSICQTALGTVSLYLLLSGKSKFGCKYY